MGANIFIDGEAGTTGLEIRDRLLDRSELFLFHLSEAERKSPSARREALNEADLVILCLPDEAAREAVAMVENPAVHIIDASTAHRGSRSRLPHAAGRRSRCVLEAPVR